MRFLSLPVLLGASVVLVSFTIPVTDAQERCGFPHNDPLARALRGASECPSNVGDFKKALSGLGISTVPAMVSNRGFHNARSGSFSVFEWGAGGTLKPEELTFGHFIEEQDGVLTLQQTPEPKHLLIEVIAWDRTKQLYNFYELRGVGGGTSRWFYRGDSADIAADIEWLYRERPENTPAFGDRLRCSGCHVNGGLIMKELAPPHNDWWRAQTPFAFGAELSAEVKSIVGQLHDASEFSDVVRGGTKRLNESARWRETWEGRTLQEQLRPIFCPLEVNLESSSATYEAAKIPLPSAPFVHPALARRALELDGGRYRARLREWGARFPESARPDAQHAWLAPVKADSDNAAIETLLARGVVDLEFVSDVLAVDMQRPFFSSQRCALLRWIPIDGSEGWQRRFVTRLKRELNAVSDRAPAIGQLLSHLTDARLDRESHVAVAEGVLEGVAKELKDRLPSTRLRALENARRAVSEAELSANLRGQILEPGFRIVFPTLDDPGE